MRTASRGRSLLTLRVAVDDGPPPPQGHGYAAVPVRLEVIERSPACGRGSPRCRRRRLGRRRRPSDLSPAAGPRLTVWCATETRTRRALPPDPPRLSTRRAATCGTFVGTQRQGRSSARPLLGLGSDPTTSRVHRSSHDRTCTQRSFWNGSATGEADGRRPAPAGFRFRPAEAHGYVYAPWMPSGRPIIQ